MKRRSRLSTLVIVVCIVAGAYAFYRSRITAIANAPRPGHVALVLDVSPSYPRACGPLGTLIDEAKRGVHVGEGSTFSMITTGGGDTSYEPKLAMNVALPRDAANPLTIDGHGQFAAALRKTCETFPPAEASLIFRALVIGLEHLAGQGCAAPNSCVLLLSSDLEENVTASVVERLRRPGGAPLLGNANVRVLVCGYSQAGGGRGPRENGQALLEGWRALFSRPEAVSFRPYCSATESQQNQSW